MERLIDELVTEVLDWWEEHQYDVEQIPGDYTEERNVYDEPPYFVVLASRLKGEV